MRILFVSPRHAWPPSSGAKLREHHLCRALGRRAKITYVFFAQPGLPIPTCEDLPFCDRIVPVPAPTFYTPAKIIRGLLGRWPLPVVNYTSSAMRSTLDQLAAQTPFDLIHLESIHLAAYVDLLAKRLPGAKLINDWHNIESEAMHSHAATMDSSARRQYARLTARRLESTERDVLDRLHGHIVCSERERLKLFAVAPQARVEVVDNGVATAFFAQPAPRNPQRIVFVGTMSYHPNREAAISFTRQVWPHIHQSRPEWRLSLVGATPPPDVQRLAEIPGVDVSGTVPDVRPYYHDALAAVVPLRSGGGTRLKILEAMAAGIPVVSTPLGAEGLDVNPGEHYLRAEQDADWLPALTQLAGDPEHGRQLAERGLRLVRSRYDWEVLGEKLVATYERWAGPSSSTPR
jgi:sugar transferase (PEP-CTERM/EpsH1 system associated)